MIFVCISTEDIIVVQNQKAFCSKYWRLFIIGGTITKYLILCFSIFWSLYLYSRISRDILTTICIFIRETSWACDHHLSILLPKIRHGFEIKIYLFSNFIIWSIFHVICIILFFGLLKKMLEKLFDFFYIILVKYHMDEHVWSIWDPYIFYSLLTSTFVRRSCYLHHIIFLSQSLLNKFSIPDTLLMIYLREYYLLEYF